MSCHVDAMPKSRTGQPVPCRSARPGGSAGPPGRGGVPRGRPRPAIQQVGNDGSVEASRRGQGQLAKRAPPRRVGATEVNAQLTRGRAGGGRERRRGRARGPRRAAGSARRIRHAGPGPHAHPGPRPRKPVRHRPAPDPAAAARPHPGSWRRAACSGVPPANLVAQTPPLSSAHGGEATVSESRCAPARLEQRASATRPRLTNPADLACRSLSVHQRAAAPARRRRRRTFRGAPRRPRAMSKTARSA